MKSFKILAMVMVIGLITFGIGFAGEAQQEKAGMAAQTQAAGIAEHAAMPESIELTGMVLSDNTFVDENGDNYQLSASEASEELQDYVGQRIRVTATVQESDEGLKNLSVKDYEILKE